MSSYDAAIIDLATLDDHRLLECSRGARFMHVEALVWSRAHRTDGAIPRGVLARIAWDEPDVAAAADELVRAGVWAVSDRGWDIVDFLATQWSKAKVEAKRQQSRDRYERWQEGGQRGRKRAAKRVGNGTDLTRPDPTRPEEEGGKGGAGARTTAARSRSDGSRRGPAPKAPPPRKPIPLASPEIGALAERWPEAWTDAPGSISPLLRVGRPVSLDGARLTLGFPENDFLLKKARGRIPTIEAHLASVFGGAWVVDVIHGTERSAS